MLFVVSIQNKSAQTYLTQKIAYYLSGKLNAKVEIKGVDIDFFKTLVLEGISIEDHHKNNLFSANRIDLNISKINSKQHTINIADIKISQMDLALKKYKDEPNLNLQFILDAFSSTDTSTSNWNFILKNIELIDCNFLYKNENSTQDTSLYSINYEDISVTNLNVLVKNVSFSNDSIFGDIIKLKLHEKSGFILEEFTANSMVSSSGIILNKLKIKTPESTINTELEFNYRKYSDFLDFNTQVIMSYLFRETNINLSDIAFFAPHLNGINKNVNFNGLILGTVNQLKGKEFELNFGDNSSLKGDFDLNGLPNVEETFIQLNLSKLTTTKEDLDKIPLPPFSQKKFLNTPANFRDLGLIKFKGEFTGFYNDFVAFGDFKTSLGNISSDLSLTIDSNNTKYKGYLALKNFNAGTYFNINELGAVTLSANIEGKGLGKNEINASLEAKIESLIYKRYIYNNAFLDGHLANKLFHGNLKINDPNIKLDFIGEVNFNEKLPEFKFTSKIEDAHLSKLNLIERDSSSLLSSNIIFDFKGIDIDNIEGNIIIKNLNYSEKEKKYAINNIRLQAVDYGLERKIKLFSDLIEGEIKGLFNIADLPENLKDQFNQILFNSIPKFNNKIEKVRYQDFEYNINIKNIHPLTELFLPQFDISNNSFLSGKYHSLNNTLSFNADVNKLSVYGNILNDLNINATISNNSFNAKINSNNFYLSDSLGIHNLSIGLQNINDSVDLLIKWNDYNMIKNKGDIKAKIAFNSLTNYKLNILSSEIYFSDSLWTIENQNTIHIDSSAMSIESLSFKSANQSINISGVFSELPNDELLINFSNFKLGNLNPLTKRNGITLKGIINGNARLADLYNNIDFRTGLNFENFNFNGDNLGNGTIISIWDKENQAINVNGKFFRGNIPTIDFSGNYFPSKEKNNIDLNLKLEKFQLFVFQNYLKNYISNIRGIASGNLHVGGEPNKPLLKGKIFIQKGGFVFDYLKTEYSFTDYILIENNWFGFNNIVINDSRGNKSFATGTILHKNYTDFNIDAVLDAKNFMVLNTTEEQNPLYFGTSFMTGRVSVSGTPDDLAINIAAKTEKGTSFNIPLYGTEEITENNFINFVNKNDINIIEKKESKIDLSGVALKFELDVTPDAEVQLIFDPKNGDIMKGKGTANLNLEINTLGKFNIYGEYNVLEGDYLFTLMNVINKKFKVERGGTIKWNGDPYDAMINLTAKYDHTKASLYELGIDPSESQKRYPVNCLLKLENELMSPTISFDIQLPTADDDIKSKLRELLNNEEEKNQQIFALLTLNRFVTPKSLQGNTETVQHNNALASNSSELLTNQISNWISQATDEFDLGFNYRPGDEISSEEVELALSTRQFNDRLSIDGSVSNVRTAGTNNVVGDFNVEYKVSEDGRIKIKAFSRPNKNSFLLNNNSSEQGVGVFYRKEFNSLRELYVTFINRFRKN